MLWSLLKVAKPFIFSAGKQLKNILQFFQVDWKSRTSKQENEKERERERKLDRLIGS